MNVVNQYGWKQNDFAEVAAFCHMICRYFNRFLLQGVNRGQRQACLSIRHPAYYVRDTGKLILKGQLFAFRTLSMASRLKSSLKLDFQKEAT